MRRLERQPADKFSTPDRTHTLHDTAITHILTNNKAVTQSIVPISEYLYSITDE